MTQAVALSRWIAESGPRPLTPQQVLRRPDIPVAATVIGVAPPEHPRTAADVVALNRPWTLALTAGLLRADSGTVTRGPGNPGGMARRPAHRLRLRNGKPVGRFARD